MTFKGALSVFCVFSTAFMPGFVQALQPHRAIYDISLDKAIPQSKITGASGKWVLEINGGACTGYNVSYRFVAQLGLEGGKTLLLDTRAKNFENAEGTAFDFSNEIYQNNTLIEDTKGVASQKEGQISVRLSRPENLEFSLSKDALFPIQHYKKLIEEAKSGSKLINSLVYEGVEGGKESMAATAIISDAKAVEGIEGKLLQTLPYQILKDEKLRHWPVSVSYFKQNAGGDAVPEWQNSYLLYENGVARQFIFDYGAFGLKGTMQKLEYLPKEEC